MTQTKSYDKARLQYYFDRAWHGVVKQGRPAMIVGGRCTYFDSENGCRCAVGHMVTPAKAALLEDQFGGMSLAQIISRESRKETWADILPRELVKLATHGAAGDPLYSTAYALSALQSIQSAHDMTASACRHDKTHDSFVADYKMRMRRVAERFGLKVPAD